MWMSVVTIITPDNLKKRDPYTRVDFLGPLLKKTAFDIMLENVSPVFKTTYRHADLSLEAKNLRVTAPKQELFVQQFPKKLETRMDIFVQDFLIGAKVVPSITLGLKVNDFVQRKWGVKEAHPRKVIYRSEAPVLMRGLYGGKERFKIKVKTLIDTDGNIKRIVPLTTTGYPRVDIIASEYVRSWIFEPNKGLSGAADQWQEVEVVLTCKD